MKTETNFFFGLVLGAATGAALGLLLAPEKGAINQQKVKEGMAHLLDNLSRLLLSNNEHVEDNTMAHIEGMEQTGDNTRRDG